MHYKDRDVHRKDLDMHRKDFVYENKRTPPNINSIPSKSGPCFTIQTAQAIIETRLIPESEAGVDRERKEGTDDGKAKARQCKAQ